MSNLDFNSPGGQGLSDLATNGKNLNTNISLLITTLQNIFPRVSGTFTLAAAATLTVSNNNVSAGTIIIPFPINAAAGTLQGSVKSLYQDMSATVSGTSFTVKTASGGAAAGTEQFAYIGLTPV